MENNYTVDGILAEAMDFKEYPVKPKTKPLTTEEIEELDRSRRERSARMAKVAEPAAVEPVPVDPAARARRKADLKAIGRAASGVAVGAGAIVAQAAGLMDIRLTVPVAAAALAFVTFWAGAWIEHKFGGLLNG